MNSQNTVPVNGDDYRSSIRHIPSRVWVYMAVIIILWGSASTVEVLTLRVLTPIQFIAWSALAGSIAVLVYMLIRGQAGKLFIYRLSGHYVLFILSLFGFSAYFFLKYTAYSISPVPQANVLQYTYTVFIALFAIPILKQEISLLKIIGIMLGFCGAAIIISGGTVNNFGRIYFPGYLCALGAGVSFGLFSVLCEKTSHDRISSLFYFQTYCALLLFLVLYLRGQLILPTGKREIAGILYNGIGPNVVGIFLWLSAQSSTDDVSILTGILYLVPFVSLMCLNMLLKLHVPLYALQGLILIVAGMIIHTVRSRRTRSPELIQPAPRVSFLRKTSRGKQLI
jgi:drug/metabolite transporter (DMT)-like permease